MNPSMVWEGAFYVTHPECGTWQLRMELQSHEPGNALYVNGHLVGYLPLKDYVYSWYATVIDVPSDFLEAGCNQLTIRAGVVAPEFQRPGFLWDDLLFRGIFLERTSCGCSQH